MNINVMQKDARTLGRYNEFKEPLEEKVDPLYVWDVAWRKSSPFGEPDTLVISNRKTGFNAIVADVKDLKEVDLDEAVPHAIRNALSALYLTDEEIDRYFEKAGEFKYGLLRDANVRNRLGEQAKKTFLGYRNLGYVETEENGDFIYPIRIKTIPPELKDEVSRTLTVYANNVIANKEDYKADLTSMDFGKKMSSELEREELPPLMRGEAKKAYEFLITLDLADDYQATRRVVVPADMNFRDFALTIIAAYDWGNSHLSEFDLSGSMSGQWPDQMNLVMELDEFFGADSSMHEMKDYRLKDLVEDFSTIEYIYDYGDYWEHQVELVGVHENYTGETPYLLEASKSTPPEDVGGPMGFEDFREAMEAGEGDEYLEYMDWLEGLPWEPELSDRESKPRVLNIREYDYSGWY